MSGELEVSALRGCPYCSRYMRWDQLACDECERVLVEQHSKEGWP